jgi:ubiquinone/menaquinone biosynthesis C-methylase UbiE
MAGYLHGYESDEQRRLIDQAAYWREKVITPGLGYRPGESVLDIGCGVGAVLGVIARETPGLRLAGIDLEERQIAFARRYLAAEGLRADLRVGDAAGLPWPDGSFDHIFTMWFFEHLRDPMPAMREARRVLKPGGTIRSIETDYAAFKIWPQHPDWDLLERAQYEYFRAHGDAEAGRRLAGRFAEAGFTDVRAEIVPFHHATNIDAAALRAHIDYIVGFLGPAVAALSGMGYDRAALERGVEHLRGLWTHPEGSTITILYRVRGSKAG